MLPFAFELLSLFLYAKQEDVCALFSSSSRGSLASGSTSVNSSIPYIGDSSIWNFSTHSPVLKFQAFMYLKKDPLNSCPLVFSRKQTMLPLSRLLLSTQVHAPLYKFHTRIDSSKPQLMSSFVDSLNSMFMTMRSWPTRIIKERTLSAVHMPFNLLKLSRYKIKVKI